jgi:hypothetical protein
VFLSYLISSFETWFNGKLENEIRREYGSKDCVAFAYSAGIFSIVLFVTFNITLSTFNRLNFLIKNQYFIPLDHKTLIKESRQIFKSNQSDFLFRYSLSKATLTSSKILSLPLICAHPVIPVMN